MSEPHLILCGDAKLSSRAQAWRKLKPRQLRIGKKLNDIHVAFNVLANRLAANATDVAVDLLELAAYVYGADQATPRGGQRSFEYGQKWRRHFRFEVPVRRPDLWSRSEVMDALTWALGYLTDDDYEFAFCHYKNAPPLQRYIPSEQYKGDSDDIAEVIPFSGGLDSLGGAVREILSGQRKVALVSHRPVSKVFNIQKKVLGRINEQVTDRKLLPVHIAVEINKGKSLTHEFSQRSRSFVFASLAAVAARLCGLNAIRFYESGVVSLNLPITAAILGGRASRTTHPLALQGFERLYQALFETTFTVANPYWSRTKADILREIIAAGHGSICADTVSCMHTIDLQTEKPHCGQCTQCIDRRMAALAAGLGDAEDPSAGYRGDVLIGNRNDPVAIGLIERYVGTATRINQMQTIEEFMDDYAGEVGRVLRCFSIPAEQVTEQVFQLYKRHASQVCEVLSQAIKDQADNLLHRRLPTNCIVSMAAGAVPAAAGPAQKTLAMSMPGEDERPVADRSTFTVRYRGAECALGNTKEFALFERLAASLSQFVTHDTLRASVWDGAECRGNTIAKAACNLRRKLSIAGVQGLTIEHAKRNYMLQPEPAPDEKV